MTANWMSTTTFDHCFSPVQNLRPVQVEHFWSSPSQPRSNSACLRGFRQCVKNCANCGMWRSELVFNCHIQNHAKNCKNAKHHNIELSFSVILVKWRIFTWQIPPCVSSSPRQERPNTWRRRHKIASDVLQKRHLAQNVLQKRHLAGENSAREEKRQAVSVQLVPGVTSKINIQKFSTI